MTKEEELQVMILQKQIELYKQERQILLDENINLANEKRMLEVKLEEAEKQIACELKDLDYCKKEFVEHHKKVEELNNQVQTLLTTLSKER